MPISLSLPADSEWLNPPACLLREQLEVFAATQRDVDERRSGPKPALGTVGLRCRHCAHLRAKPRGAVAYPASLSQMYQAARNFQRYHFFDCPETPDAIKEKMGSFGPKERQGSGTGKKRQCARYWVESSRDVLGLVDVEETVHANAGKKIKGGQAHIRFRGDCHGEENWAIPLLNILGDEVERDMANARRASERAEGRSSSQRTEPIHRTVMTSDGGSTGTVAVAGHEHEHEHATALLSSSASSASVVQTQLLNVLKTFLDVVQTIKKVEPCPNLVDIGKRIYRGFVGTEPSDNVLSEGQQLALRDDSVLEEARGALEGSRLANEQNECDTSEMSRIRRPVQRGRDQTDSATGAPFAGPPVDAVLREAGLPVQLSILIINLLTADDEQRANRYVSIDEVEHDLLGMLADPDRYLFDMPLERQTGRLEFPRNRLYGRDVQQTQFAAPFDRVIRNGAPREAVYVSGISGSGKSSFVELQLRLSLFPAGGRIIYGKFDALRQRQPVAVLCQALDAYCEALAADTDGQSLALCAAIASALNVGGLEVLRGLMPSLSKIVPDDDSTNNQALAVQRQTDGALSQLFYYLSLFLRAIATPVTPVVLFLDDTHWADEAALDMVTTLISERSLTSLLFIGCYREDEVHQSHPMIKHRQELTQAGVFCTDIVLGGLEKPDCHKMISDLLHLPPRTTQSLSDAVYAKTSGNNPLFVVQFLRSLYDDGLLWYSARSRHWEFDIISIQARDLDDNVAALLTSKISGMDPRAQELLKWAACFGSEFKESLLSKIGIRSDRTGNEPVGLMERGVIIQLLVNEGMLSRVGNDMIRFSHDSVQQSAYHLIPQPGRPAVHLRIGRDLRQKTQATEELDEMIFVVVEQYMAGIDMLTDPHEKIEVARLCLVAGKKAMARSEFGPASIYHLQGTALLQAMD